MSWDTSTKREIGKIRNFEKMLGNGLKLPQKCEIKNMKIARKSIVARKKINKGEKFDINNITVKRPAGGLDRSVYFHMIGKLSKNAISKHCLLLNGPAVIFTIMFHIGLINIGNFIPV